MVLLGNDKCNNHLPQILPQYPDPFPEFSGARQIAVPAVNLLPKGLVIRIQIKIILPDTFKRFFFTAEQQPLFILLDFQIMIPRHHGKPAPTHVFHTEALSRITNLPNIYIISTEQYHVSFFLSRVLSYVIAIY